MMRKIKTSMILSKLECAEIIWYSNQNGARIERFNVWGKIFKMQLITCEEITEKRLNQNIL